MRKSVLILLLMVSSFNLYAELEKMTFEHYSIKNGLSDGRIDCILQDSYGFLWFGAQDGLNRFDGYSFKVFGHDIFDESSISSDWIRCILQDNNGQLWVGTEGGGLNRFNYETETFDRWIQDNSNAYSLNDNFVRALCEDSNGVLWVGTRTGLLKFDRKNERFHPFHSLPNDTNSSVFNENITEIIEDRLGNLWLGTSNDIFRINQNRSKITHFPNENSAHRITSIFQDSYGDIWFGSRYSGLRKFDPDAQVFKSLVNNPSDPFTLSSNEIKDIFEDNDQNLWVATIHGGLNLFDRASERFTHFKHTIDDPTSISSNSVRVIYQDRNGVMWLGMDGSGIDRFYQKEQKFEYYSNQLPNNSELINSTVLSILEDSQGALWLGTEGEGLVQFSRSNNSFVKYKHDSNNTFSISSNQVTFIYEDDGGALWVGTKEGLNRFSKHKKIFHRYYIRTTPITGNNFINTILPVGEDELWLGTNGGLVKFDKKNSTFQAIEFDTSGVLNDEVINSLWLESDGHLWIGYLRSGLVQLDVHTNQFTHYRSNANSPNSPSSNFIQYIFNDSQNRLWIGTRKGLNQYDPVTGNFKRYDKSDGLPSNVIAGIVQDNDNNLWLSTTNGLSRFNISEKTFNNFTTEDGLQGNQFWTRSCFKSKSGELFFGGNNGFNAFFPDYLTKLANPKIPPITITNISVMNKPLTKSIYPFVYSGETLNLESDKNQISFEFSALDFSNPGKNQFAYKLDGFETEWNYVGTRRFANYTNLKPGRYTFQVKGSNSDGVWNERGAELAIYIPTPFGKTVWAYLIYFIIAGGIIYGINAYIFALVHAKHDLKLERLERKKALEINQFKLQFFTDIAHEFKTPLTLIQAPLEEMLASVDKKNPHADEMGLMYRNVKYLMRLIQQLLCFRRVEHGSLKLETSRGNIVQFAVKVFEMFKETARKHNINYTFKSETEDIEGWFDWEKIEEVLVNMIDNAFKYSADNGAVVVELELHTSGDKQDVIITIKDHGKGISPEDQEHIFERFYHAGGHNKSTQASSGLGLALAKKFIEMHSGSIEVESELDKGSTFKIKLPLGTSHLDESQIIELENSNEKSVDFNISDFQNETEGATLEESTDNSTVDRNILLIVDDDDELRSFMSKKLAKHYSIIEASDGQEGLEKAIKYLPSLIISDVLMPRMDGISLTKALKDQVATSHIPIILLSARSDVEDKIQGIEKGADDYIEKPFHFKFLEARIFNILQSRKTLQERYRKEFILEPSNISAFSHDEKLLVQVREYIEQHMAEPELGVKHLAYQLGLSRTMLFMKLKELVGYSPQEFIKVMRLKKAAQMLTKTDYTISEIAYRVGFKYPKYFSTCFQQEYEMTPSEFREGNVSK